MDKSEVGYDIKEMKRKRDWIGLMTGDRHLAITKGPLSINSKLKAQRDLNLYQWLQLNRHHYTIICYLLCL